MIYLLFGEEQYLVKKTLSRVLAEHKDAAVEKLDAPELLSLVETINIPSLFAPQRVIIVDSLDLSEADDNFISCLSSLPQGVTLILKNPAGLDRRSKVFKAISSLGEVHECKPIPEWEESQVVEFVINAFAEYKKKIDTDLARILVEGVGRNLGLLQSEAQKITTYMGERAVVDKSDIEKLMVRSGWDAYSFAQAVLDKNCPLALKTLIELIREKENPVELLGLLSAQMRMLFKIKLLASMGQNPPQIAKRLKASPYYINRLYEASRNFKLEKLKDALGLLYNTDLKLKSGYDHKTELSLLVTELTNA